MKRRPFLGRLRQGERGAVATIFAVLLAGGVVMGMMALSIDVGSIMFERRQLQNGADATSLALADACGANPATCAPDQVEYLLSANAADSSAQYGDRYPDGACAREGAITNLNGAIPPCESISVDAEITDLAECPPLPDWLAAESTIPYVETYSRTKSEEANNTILPSYFSKALIGGPGATSSVKACARAAWGPAGGHTGSVPITISTCEWLDATNANPLTLEDGQYYEKSPAGAWPGYDDVTNPWPATSWEVMMLLHDPQDESTDCNWNNKDTAGGFGYVDGDNCSATITTTASQDSWAKIDPGNNVPQGCDTVIPGLLGKVIYIPVFDCLISAQEAPDGGIPLGANCDPTQQEANGTNSWYHIAGWAKFYLSGYRLGGNGGVVHSSILPGSNYPGPCTSSQRCISGWFLKGSLDDATSIVPPGSGADFGTYAVLPAG